MNTTKTVSTTSGITKIREKISPAVANIALFLFSVAMVLRIITPEGLSSQIKNEKEKMVKFGFDTGMIEMLQGLVGYFKPNSVSTLSRDNSAIIAYYYLVYSVTNGVNVTGWISGLIPTAFNAATNGSTVGSTVPSNLNVTKQLVSQKCSISNVLRGSTAKSSETSFMSVITDWVSKVRKQFLYFNSQLGITVFTPNELSEFIGCIVQDSHNMKMIKVAVAATKHKAYLAEEANCEVTVIETFTVELRKSSTDPTRNVSIINTVFNALEVKGITASDILDLGNFTPSNVVQTS
ncbi:MAG: hypothetical protein WAV23_00025 [Minisyncoccia bacterium]